MIERVRELCQNDERLVSSLMYGSFAIGEADRFSDIEFYLFFAEEASEGLREEAWIAQIAPLYLYYVNEVGTGPAIFENLVRGEFHLEAVSDVGLVDAWERVWFPSLESAVLSELLLSWGTQRTWRPNSRSSNVSHALLWRPDSRDRSGGGLLPPGQEEAPGAPSEAGASRSLRFLVALPSVLRLVHLSPFLSGTGDRTGPVWARVASGRPPRGAADRLVWDRDLRMSEAEPRGGRAGRERGPYLTRDYKVPLCACGEVFGTMRLAKSRAK